MIGFLYGNNVPNGFIYWRHDLLWLYPTWLEYTRVYSREIPGFPVILSFRNHGIFWNGSREISCIKYCRLSWRKSHEKCLKITDIFQFTKLMVYYSTNISMLNPTKANQCIHVWHFIWKAVFKLLSRVITFTSTRTVNFIDL